MSIATFEEAVETISNKMNKTMSNDELKVEMWYPDTWISGYLDIQAILAIHYPDTKKVEISKYPSIHVSMISM